MVQMNAIKIILLLIACSSLAMAAASCNDNISEELAIPGMVTDVTSEGSDGSDIGDETTAGPAGWNEESHGNGVDPNYDVVFPEDQVNQIAITVAPDDWEAMQANMTELFGEAGAGGGGRDFPGGGFEDPPGQFLDPGGDGFPEGFEPPQGDFPQDVEPPVPGDQPVLPEGIQPGGRAAGRGFGPGDMTPENPMWVEATIEFQGNTWTHVGLRYKGNSSLTSGWRSGELKLPLKLDFDEFEDEYPEIDDQRFYGFKQLSLADGFSDYSFLRDAATSAILQDAGLPAAETAFYEVFLDYGEGPVSLGLYTVIEVVDDTVVDKYFGSDDGNIYEADGSAATFAATTYDQIPESFQKENNEDEADWGDIEALFEVLHADERNEDPAAWRANLEELFDVNAFLEWLAISSVIQHWDAYGNMSHNYYLYNDPKTGQLTWISWDHNMAMSEGMGGGGDPRGGPGGQGVSLDKAEIGQDWPLIRFLLDDPVYYDRYLDYLAATIEGPFNADRMAERYRQMADLIAPYAIADVGPDAFNSAVQQLIDHAYQRANTVEEFLTSIGD